MAKGVNVVNTKKLISNISVIKNLNEKYYQYSTLFYKCTGHTSNKANSRILDINPRGLEVLSNWNLNNLITRALHYLGDQIGCGIKSI